MRYKVSSEWTKAHTGLEYGNFIVQEADIIEVSSGRTYRDGARRVIDKRTGKPAVRGKGGTVPFFGEMAWANSERLASDLYMKERYAR
jgi:hypothetical protein